MDAFFTSSGLLALVTLTFLEIVLGVDNVIFISILSGKLPRVAARPGSAGRTPGGDGDAHPAAAVDCLDHPADGAALLYPGRAHLRTGSHPDRRRTVSAREGDDSKFTSGWRAKKATARRECAPSFGAVITQITVLDIVFSLDSVITAVGMADDIAIMVTAVVLSVGVMMFSAGPISAFVESPSDGQSAGAVVPAADWRFAGRRRPRHAHPEGLHLLCDGLLGLRGDDQPARPESRCACSPARAVRLSADWRYTSPSFAARFATPKRVQFLKAPQPFSIVWMRGISSVGAERGGSRFPG